MFKIIHRTKPHFLLAICDTMEGANRWIENFNPLIWDDKSMTRDDLIIVKG